MISDSEKKLLDEIIADEADYNSDEDEVYFIILFRKLKIGRMLIYIK